MDWNALAESRSTTELLAALGREAPNGLAPLLLARPEEDAPAWLYLSSVAGEGFAFDPADEALRDLQATGAGVSRLPAGALASLWGVFVERGLLRRALHTASVEVITSATRRERIVVASESESDAALRSFVAELVSCAPQLFALLRGHLARETNERAGRKALRHLRTMIETRDPYTRGHCERVGRYTAHLARAIAATRPERGPRSAAHLRDIVRAAEFHDLGKVFVRGETINAPGRLSDVQRMEINRHPLLARDLLGVSPEGRRIARFVECHHERPAGGGYPWGLSGSEVPDEARMIAVADVFDAITSNRSYRKPFDDDRAMETLVEEAKKGWLDDEFVHDFCELVEWGVTDLVRAEDLLRAAASRDEIEVFVRKGIRRAREAPARFSDQKEVLRRLLVVEGQLAIRERTALASVIVDLVPYDPGRLAQTRLETQRTHDEGNRRPEAVLEAERLMEIGAGAVRAAIDARDASWEVVAEHLKVLAEAALYKGSALRQQGDLYGALSWLHDARRSALFANPEEEDARILDALGNLHLTRGELDTAEDLLRRSEVLKVQSGDIDGLAITLGGLSRVALLGGDLDRSELLARESEALSQSRNNARGVAVALGQRAYVSLFRARRLASKDPAAAETARQSAIALFSDLVGRARRSTNELAEANARFGRSIAILDGGDEDLLLRPGALSGICGRFTSGARFYSDVLDAVREARSATSSAPPRLLDPTFLNIAESDLESTFLRATLLREARKLVDAGIVPGVRIAEELQNLRQTSAWYWIVKT